MSSKSKKEPEKDPYEVLGVDMTASDADITKAYRKLALKLHPDKQSGLSEKQRDKLAQDFHDLQAARAFLLDAEFAQARTEYKKKLASKKARQQADAAREHKLSAYRKHLRDQLKRQEEQAAKNKDDRRKKKRKQQDDDDVERLRRQGKQMREAYADRVVAAESFRDDESREKQKRLLQDRQVRLKWSRKKVKQSPSEHSLATLLGKFGSVERVEMIGSKGNAALVTFENASSCKPCVQSYAESDEMRASYVGKRKDREEEAEYNEPLRTTNTTSRDAENVQDWKLRQAAEREKLLRQMEQEENDGDESVSKLRPQKADKGRSTAFPPLFPANDDYKGLSPLSKLEKSEDLLLKGVVPDESLQRIKIAL